MRANSTRRRVLALGAAAVASLAGCASDDDDGADGTATPTTDAPSPTPTASETVTAHPTTTDDSSPDSTTTATTPALDLREANVVAVAVERRDDGVRFDVTLYHDDDGEAGYANWWQVETLDGERLGRRELLHSHGTREFTRSATIQVPAGVDCVVVRGHDRTHGYGGRAMLVNVSSGATTSVRQGSDKQSMAGEAC